MKRIIEVKNLKKYFKIRSGKTEYSNRYVAAVDDVSFSIERGETLGLVGESGCGKTTISRCILRLLEASSGSVFFEGREIFGLRATEMREIRRNMQIIFQDPYSSLNPRSVILDIVGEGLSIHKMVKTRTEMAERVSELVKKVGLQPDIIYRYPHEFSGGQRQRIAIARAIALSPSFIICDEPVSSLDVSIQAQIMNLLIDFQKELSLAYLFIAHDLAVVKLISHTIAVMYSGQIVEMAPTEELFQNPVHPYTISLLSSIPIPDPRISRKRIVRDDFSNGKGKTSKGCLYASVCDKAGERCFENKNDDVYINSSHMVKCIKAFK